MTTRQQQKAQGSLDQRSYAIKVFGAKYAVKNERPGRWPEWNYFRTEKGANTFNEHELKGRGKVIPL